MHQWYQISRGKYRFNMAVLITLIFAVMAAGGVWMLTRATADTAVQNVIYVTVNGTGDGSSWENAVGAASLDWAVQQSAASKDKAVEVWVASGDYKRWNTLDLTQGAKLYGGFAGDETTEASRNARDIATNKTTLNGQGGLSIVAGGENATSNDTRIDGFTITGGQSEQSGGGGMRNETSSPTVANCTFSKNSTGNNGGGMYNTNSSPIVTNCTFSKNDASISSSGGGMYNYSNSNPTVTNCTFSENYASSSGGGMSNEDNSSPTVTNCTFSGNYADGSSNGYGGGMCNSYSNPTITNCTFSGNYANDIAGAVAVLSGCDVKIINSSFSDNTAGNDGGAIKNEGELQIINCTFSGNKANDSKVTGGGALKTGDSSSSTIVVNSIFWGNSAANSAITEQEIRNNEGTLIIQNCVVSGDLNLASGSSSKDIISGNPMIISVDKDMKDTTSSADFYMFTISGNSSARGKGLNVGTRTISGDTSVDIPSTDQRGSERPATGVDIGAYQYEATTIPVTGVSLPSKDVTLHVGGTAKLTATVSPDNATNKTVTWMTSDATTASVADGTVTAHKAGTATITVTTQDGGKTATCTVTVSDTAIPVDGVSLTPAAVTLYAGETKALTAAITPDNAANKTVTWATSDAATASVADGTVTAHKAGTATITVTTQDGGKTATCSVTVSDANEKETAKPTTPPTKPENAPDDIMVTSGPVEVISVQPGATDEEKKNAVTGAAGQLEGITSGDLEADGSTVKIKENLAKKLAEGLLEKELSDDAVVPLPVFTAVCGAADGRVLMAAFEMTGSSFFADKPENVRLLKILSNSTAEFLGCVSKAEDFADGKFTVMTMDDAIFTGEFAADTTYKLVVFIKDGGKYDLDAGSERNADGSKKPNGRIADPLAIIKTDASPTPTPTPNHNGGSGCNSGAFGGMAMAAMAVCTALSRKKK